MSSRIMLTRIFMPLAVAFGVIELIVGFSDKEWKLGFTGWFEEGVPLAILSIVVLADEDYEQRGTNT